MVPFIFSPESLCYQFKFHMAALSWPASPMPTYSTHLLSLLSVYHCLYKNKGLQMFKRNEQNLMLICHFYEHQLWQKCQQLNLYVLFDTEKANFLLKWNKLPFNHIFIFLMVEDPVLLQAYSQFTELKLKRRDNKHGFQYHFPHESCCFISTWVFYMTPTFMLQRSQSPTSMLSNLFLYYYMVKFFFETAYFKNLCMI